MKSVSVSANTTYATNITFDGIDTSKIIFSDISWSNSATDVPTYITKYYIGQALNRVDHKWTSAQTVNLMIRVVYINI